MVESLKAKGAVFVEELNEIPETDQPVIFFGSRSAEAVPPPPAPAICFSIDATCPLVFKVHMEAARHHAEGYDILLIGHAGTRKWKAPPPAPARRRNSIETVADAEAIEPRNPEKLSYVTQTTCRSMTRRRSWPC